MLKKFENFLKNKKTAAHQKWTHWKRKVFTQTTFYYHKCIHFFIPKKRVRCIFFAHEPFYVYKENVCLFTFLTIIRLKIKFCKKKIFLSASIFLKKPFFFIFNFAKNSQTFLNDIMIINQNGNLRKVRSVRAFFSVFFCPKSPKKVPYISYLHKFSFTVHFFP